MLQLADVVERDDGSQPVDGMVLALAADDVELLFGTRVAELGLEEEAVELGLGQRERALLLDRVLRRHEEERRRHLARHPVDGHLVLGHRLEQGRLRLRHRTVDLVDEQHVREDRAGAELELADALVEHRKPGDVRRLQVRRALDPGGGRALDRAGERSGEDRLCGPGDVLEEDVAACRERGDDEIDAIRLAVYDRLDVRAQPLRGRGRALEALVRLRRRLDVLLSHSFARLSSGCSVTHTRRALAVASIGQPSIP